MLRRSVLLALGLLIFEAAPVVAEDAAEDADEEEDEEDDTPKEPDVIDGFSKDDLAKMQEGAETHDFQAEVSRLMDIIINSLYGNKDVFLRELLSNAGDALERARFSQIQDSGYGGPKDLEIKIEMDEAAKTLSIQDTGCGMTKRELIENLGTVAKSGTTNFLEALKDGGGDASTLIGQFGVGFYSAFLVADTVYVTSVSADDIEKQHIWQSAADGSFTVTADPRGNTLGRGSRITLVLKEEALEYLKKDKIEGIVQRYSQFMTHPILAKDDSPDAEDDDDELDDEDEEKEEKEDKVKPVKWKRMNKQQPIWMRSKDDITEAEYHEFYKSIGKDVFEPLSYTHFNAEGDIEFKSILYIPKRAPHDMNMGNVEGWASEIKLYVRRVLVADQFDQLLPRYLMWVKGVVDSDDLPLNVNREQLQQNKILKVISKKLTRKVLEMMKKLAKDEKEDDEDDEEDDDEDEKAPSTEKTVFEKFYDEFKNFLLMGCHEDDANRSKISKLLRFISTHTEKQEGKKLTSLEDYVSRMQEEQPAIYYMTGDKVKEMEKEIALEVYSKKELEVLLLDDPYAEQCVSKISDFEGVKLRSVQKAGDLRINWSKDEAQRYKDFTTMYKPLTKWWEKHTGNAGVKIDKVEVSRRLVSAPAVVVSTEFGFSARQERLNKVNDQQDAAFSTSGKVLELNPDHPVIYDLLQKVKADEEDSSLEETANLVAQAAVLQSGFELDDPSIIVNSIYDLVSAKYDVDPKAQVEPVEVVLPEEPKVEDVEDADDEDEEGADEEDEEPEKPEL